tara:strand:- start:61470 stop:61970 length:501 start_codon:yes stop_codon:yes gene_type:complete
MSSKPHKVITEKEYQALVEKVLNESYTFREVQGISDESMDAIYSIAYSLYQNSKYEDAHKVFQFLCFYDHYEKRYWLGLAACRQMLKEYEGAVDAYGFAAFLDTDDPKIPLYAADCLLASGDKERAQHALESVVEFAGNKKDHKSLKERAQNILGLIQDDNKKGGK